MPWNFPYWQALRFAAPSLMVGNTIVLKPASATMQCGIEIEKTFEKAGLADGVFQTLVGDSSIADILIDSEDVNAITFTGVPPKHILATSGYPLYAFPWIEVESGIYAWDGGLLSNTPLREVIDASPVNDKQVFLVENYPKNITKLPKNLPEVYHRARDIMFNDKTELNITMSKVISMYLRYIDEMYHVIEEFVDMNKADKKRIEKIRLKYKKYKKERGAEIKKIWHITRHEPFPFIYENADFSLEAIKSSITDGELKTNQILEKQSR